MVDTAVRTLVAWCPDWPVVAAGASLDEPVAVVRANRVVACSPAARGEGVTVGLRRRDAQARCPELLVLSSDPATETRAFEPIAASLEALTPRVEVVHPGCAAFPTLGPSRYHGGDTSLAHAAALLAASAHPSTPSSVIPDHPSPASSVSGLASSVPGPASAAGVGVADGLFAATLAARRAAAIAGKAASAGEVADNVLVVPPGESGAFLAPLSLRTLDLPDLVDVLRRLGLRTLGDLAALPEGHVVGRFGTEGRVARRLASGLDPRPPATTPPPPDLQVDVELDPPAERVETAAFAARGLADELHRRLTRRGSACTLLLIGAETEHGERHERIWRTDGTFGPAAIADRLRWQLDGWLAESDRAPRQGPEWPDADGANGRPSSSAGRPGPEGLDVDGARSGKAGSSVGRPGFGRSGGGGRGEVGLAGGSGRPTGGLIRLWLYPYEVVAAGGRQLSFGAGGGDAVVAAEHADRSLARVQALVGVEGALLPEWRGGRGPGERVVLVDAVGADLTVPRLAGRREWVGEPWPGAVPEPAPAVVHPQPLPVRLLDRSGYPVRVSGRGVLSDPPATLATRDRGRPDPVVRWAGPWPCEERWWDASGRRRRARLQVVTGSGTAHLLILEAGRWALEASYG